MGRRLAVVLLGLALVACSYTDAPLIGRQPARPPPSRLGAAAIQPSEVPPTTTCAGSGPSLVGLGAGAAGGLKPAVQRLPSDGQVELWVQLLAISQLDCTGLATGGGMSPPTAINVLIRYRDEATAARAFGHGLGSLRVGADGTTAGVATGLGPSSVTRVTLTPSYAAFRQHGGTVAYAEIAGLSTDDAARAARAAGARLG